MTLISELKKICKDISGNVLTIGLEFPTVEQVLEKNTNIKNSYSLDFNGKKRTRQQTTNGKGKTIFINKIRKVFKKKKIDFIICNFEDIGRFLRTFIKDSVYINKSKLYIYGYTKDIDLELLEKRYKRYNTKIEILEFENQILITIDNSNAKNNPFKDFGYYICDIGYSLINLIGDLLIS
ncbi:MAG: hypothetical protein E7165_00855 [Firmicutes bacterium]|nr:hypothetical protein [Bacillota bacterium]